MENVIYGRNPVREALRGNRPLNKVVLAKGVTAGIRKEIMALAKDKNIPVQTVARNYLDRLTGGAAHQGVAALVARRFYVEIEDILAGKETPLIVALHGVQDPRNLGAVIRTAEAAGVDGVVIPSRRAASLTETVAKASAGAVEYLPVARVTNMARTLRGLKEKGFWIVGAEADGSQLYWNIDLKGPLVLVVGGEDTGLGQTVRKECDVLVRIPMAGKVNSLNVSVAAGLLIYEALRQRGLAHGQQEQDPSSG
ncbi:MAG: 23S rRNA (guanosine(2251)-2'-O)-methyltransferase RlmB [Peptococcaceae bacterium]|nr:23S rRNA (guanosine(2251)-2'-O)-methyltransferase RlmB [Peptococcaceae bacterium]